MTPFAAIDFETANRDPASACSVGIVSVGADGTRVRMRALERVAAVEGVAF